MKNNSLSSLTLYTPYLARLVSLGSSGAYYAVLAGLLSLALFTTATATDFMGSLKGVTITDTANTNKAPIATFTYSVSGDTVSFDASGSTDPDGTIAAYKWDFGDGQSGVGTSTTHTYASKGNFNVILTVTDNAQGVALHNQLVTTLINFAEQTISDAESANIHTTRTTAQGFYLNSAQTLHGITIKTGSNGYFTTPVVAKMRVGTSTNLSVSYLAESQPISIASNNTEYEFLFTTPILLDANTQYFFAVSATDDSNMHWFTSSVTSRNPYAPSGSTTSVGYAGTGEKFNAPTNYDNYDLYFKMR